jgi:hypothetical protein
MNLAALIYGAAVLAGVSGCTHLFTPPYRSASTWLRTVLFILVATAMVWGALGIFVILQQATLSRQLLWQLEHARTALGGLVVGMSVIVLTSPEYRQIRRSKSEP